MIKIIIIGLICLNLSGNIVFAQGKSQERQNKPNKSNKVKTIISAEKSFDMNIDKLPPNFNGHDIKAVYELFEENKEEAAKGEFETTAEYNKRYVPMNLSTVYAFKLESELTNEIDDYDADNKSLSVSIVNDGIPTGNGYDISPGLLLKKHEKPMGSYIGENAFGARREIIKLTQYYYFLAIDNYKAMGTEVRGFRDGFNYKLNISGLEIQDAKLLKPNLAILVVCKAYAEPFLTYKHTSHDEPSIKYTYEVTKNGYWINVKVLEFWVYNEKTGKIYLKNKISDGETIKKYSRTPRTPTTF